MCVFVCVCVSAPRLLITSGVMWYDIDMAAVVGIVNGHGISIHMCRGN